MLLAHVNNAMVTREIRQQWLLHDRHLARTAPVQQSVLYASSGSIVQLS